MKVDAAINLNSHGERAWGVRVISSARGTSFGEIFSSLRSAAARAKVMKENARDDEVFLVEPIYVNCFQDGTPKLMGMRRE